MNWGSHLGIFRWFPLFSKLCAKTSISGNVTFVMSQRAPITLPGCPYTRSGILREHNQATNQQTNQPTQVRIWRSLIWFFFDNVLHMTSPLEKWRRSRGYTVVANSFWTPHVFLKYYIAHKSTNAVYFSAVNAIDPTCCTALSSSELDVSARWLQFLLLSY